MIFILLKVLFLKSCLLNKSNCYDQVTEHEPWRFLISQKVTVEKFIYIFEMRESFQDFNPN